jgi:hypothetical protein
MRREYKFRGKFQGANEFEAERKPHSCKWMSDQKKKNNN